MLSKTTVLVSVLLLLTVANLMLVEARDERCNKSGDCKRAFKCNDGVCTCTFGSDCNSGRCFHPTGVCMV
ncbi:hypothetical protein DdX_11716 [Ditylenchus destructor]|uniref:Uncharacterized protein n=1 Tax=Ditylenchus destructor TaxID=166010 RepID=A0AAD4QXY1_9BILA|nr:hypothetical protein DdX_11716 [Ditylenchus destructor]